MAGTAQLLLVSQLTTLRNLASIKKLKNDVDLRRWSTRGRRTVALGELPIVSLHIVEPHFNRLQELHTHWSDLEKGTVVLCRSRREHPEDFFKSGHGNPWSMQANQIASFCAKRDQKEIDFFQLLFAPNEFLFNCVQAKSTKLHIYAM